MKDFVHRWDSDSFYVTNLSLLCFFVSQIIWCHASPCEDNFEGLILFSARLRNSAQDAPLSDTPARSSQHIYDAYIYIYILIELYRQYIYIYIYMSVCIYRYLQ